VENNFLSMLAIRMQRTGRKGHAMFRMVVQDSRRTPTSGRVVALLGSYDPHAKTLSLQKDKASFYLEHGARPSARVIRLLVSEGVALPAWVNRPGEKKRAVRTADKLRRNRPAKAETAAPEAAAEPTDTAEPAKSTETGAAVSAKTTEPESPESAAAVESSETPADNNPAASDNPEEPAVKA
jgi:small subunit ribosomal protein S16